MFTNETSSSPSIESSRVELLGTEYYFSSKPNEYTGWILFIALPYDEIIREAHSIFKKLVYLFGFIVVAIVLANLVLVSHAILKPLHNITDVITRLRSGEKQVRAAIHSRDEYGIMAAEFNHLIDIVENHLKNLEEEINRRTSRLIALEHENTRLRIIEEKERISRDLHDTIGAKLTNIRICNSMGRSLGHEEKGIQQIHDLIEENCAKAIRELRLIVSDLDGEWEDHSDLHRFLNTQLPRIMKLRNIRFQQELDWPRIEQLDQETKTEIEKILEELFNNIIKHSHASRTVLCIQGSEEKLSLIVEDNGVGFNAEKIHEGYGVKSLTKRVDQLGGDMVYDFSSDAEGTAIRILLPIHQEKAIAFEK